jgi:hypothetical protein
MPFSLRMRARSLRSAARTSRWRALALRHPHHAGHRPVWAAGAESKKVFVATIGRAQRTEKARLSTELARDERVLAEIDALSGTGA